MNKESKFIMALVFIIFGLIIAIQFKSVLYANNDKPSIAYKIDRLKEQINEQIVFESKYKEEIDKYLKEKDSIERSFIESKNDSTAKEEWDKSRLLAGLTDVMGDGIIIKIDDALNYLGRELTEEEINDMVIHDHEVLRVMNELKIEGAQAISINNERIISNTEIICAGPTIRLNRTRYSVPVEFKAIGDANNLYENFTKSAIFFNLKSKGKRIEIIKSNNIIIPKYNGEISSLISGMEVLK